MNQQEIIEGNKLIAEFIGWQYNSKGFWEQTIFDFHKELKFHKSWDWLMPVVEKILYNTPNSEKWAIYKISDYVGSIDIKSTYKTVIEFIKWYNEKNILSRNN